MTMSFHIIGMLLIVIRQGDDGGGDGGELLV